MANTEGKHITTIEGLKIHYRIKGTGPQTLLLIHSAVGSLNDFALQFDDAEANLNKDENRFTLVAYDMPGFGGSEMLPDKTMKCLPTMQYFKFCAQIGHQLMEKLKFKTYAVCGWSDGARVASLIAINYQSRVDALILWGFIPQIDRVSTDSIAKTRNTSTWEPKVLENYVSIYGEQKFSDLWRKYVDFIVASLDFAPIDQLFDIRNQLHKIKCPTLVLHGMLDPLVNFCEHIEPLAMRIYDYNLMQFKGAAHNIHQADPIKFNQVLTNFIICAQS